MCKGSQAEAAVGMGPCGEVVLAEVGCCSARLAKKGAAVLYLLGKRHLCGLNNTVMSGDS